MKNSFAVLAVFTFLLLSFNAKNIPAQEFDRKIFKNRSAPGARAAMGIFNNAYARALTKDVFSIDPNSFGGRLSTLFFASAGYQIVSYDRKTGIEVRPTELNKPWKGFWSGYLAAEGMDIFLQAAKTSPEFRYFSVSILAVTMGVIIAEGERNNRWRYADDKPLTWSSLKRNRHSYFVHFAGSGGLYWAFANHTKSPEAALFYTSAFVWLWEVKDGYLQWEELGHIGGDGFSWRDGMAGTIATVGSYVIDRVVFPAVKFIFTGPQPRRPRGHGRRFDQNMSLMIRPNQTGMNVDFKFAF